MKRVLIVAGEASGDLHAEKLISAVNQRSSEVKFFGIGGPKMKAAGVEILVDSSELAVVGLIEVLAHRKVIFGALNQMRELLQYEPPDLLLLVDYPDFNLRLAKTAKKCGVKVLYYISPQVWAWRQKRVHAIRKIVDMMAVVFPFEEEFYLKHDVPVRFVGHPLTDEVKVTSDKSSLFKALSLNTSHKTLGLFPGSRQSEIKRLLPIILESADILSKRIPDLQLILPIASTLKKEDIETYLVGKEKLNIKLISNHAYDVMNTCDAIITVSGTATLEIALIGTPMVIINKVSWLTYQIVKRLVKIKYIGLCNIVANQLIAPELIQHNAKPEKIADAAYPLLVDEDINRAMRKKLSNVKEVLADKKNEQDIADITLEMLGLK